MNDIYTIAANLRTQDNRITANPIFMVQVKVRELGDPDNDDPHYWVSRDWEEVDDDLGKLLDEAEEMGESEILDPDGDPCDVNDYSKVTYREVYHHHQPFFTEVGAKRYIEINGHNLREPRIYVEGGWRNEEWETIRAHLIGTDILAKTMAEMSSVSTPPDIAQAINRDLFKLL